MMTLSFNNYVTLRGWGGGDHRFCDKALGIFVGRGGDGEVRHVLRSAIETLLKCAKTRKKRVKRGYFNILVTQEKKKGVLILDFKSSDTNSLQRS